MRDDALSQLKQICRNYRSKPYYVNDRTGGFFMPRAGEDCWCLLTQGPVGPDDRFVGCDDCKPGRSCFFCQITD